MWFEAGVSLGHAGSGGGCPVGVAGGGEAEELQLEWGGRGDEVRPCGSVVGLVGPGASGDPFVGCAAEVGVGGEAVPVGGDEVGARWNVSTR